MTNGKNIIGFLIPDKKYRVVKEFRDYDSAIHPEGEEWIYQSCNFVPYHDRLSLFVIINGKEDRSGFEQSPKSNCTLLKILAGI